LPPLPRCLNRVRSAAAWYRRLTLGLLLAPVLLWLFGLIVLPHVDLAMLSLRERVAPRQYAPSLAQFRTFSRNRSTGTCS